MYRPVLLLLGPGIKAGCTVTPVYWVPAVLPCAAAVSGNTCPSRVGIWLDSTVLTSSPLSFLIGSIVAVSLLHLQLTNRQFIVLLHLFDWSSRSQLVSYSSLNHHDLLNMRFKKSSLLSLRIFYSFDVLLSSNKNELNPLFDIFTNMHTIHTLNPSHTLSSHINNLKKVDLRRLRFSRD